MLFSGASIPPKKEAKKEKKIERDEKLEIQEAVFIRWAAALLEDEARKFEDLADTRNIAAIAQLVTGQSISLTGARPDDVHAIIRAIGDTKSPPHELVEGTQKAVLNTWWTLIQLFWKRYGPPPINEDKLSEALKNWCVEAARDYEETTIVDFASSWRDGFAFNVLLHNFDPKSVDMEAVATMPAVERIDSAFAVAESMYGVPRLLHARDLQSEHLDYRSVVTYLMSMYLALVGRSNVGRVAYKAKPAPLARQLTISGEEGTSGLTQSQLETAVERATTASVHSASSSTVLGTSASTEGSQGGERGGERREHISRRQQSFEQTMEDPPSHDMRSRKSSSSSHRSSSKSKRARKEELAREFDACLEHVLAWLLEAEEEVASLSDVESREVGTVKRQFKEYEALMGSLTESQETVGRVLHRGQVLLQRVDNDSEKDTITQQLILVNTRWEQLRELAMSRQASLQSQLNALQTAQLSVIAGWLSETEAAIEAAEPLADTADGAIRQIERHSAFQRRLDDYQTTIDQLGSFVAVVDEEEGSSSLAVLEQRLASIGARWAAICDWSERRASGLDGLAEICEKTEEAYAHLEDWLKHREQELLGLRSVHHLESEAEVAEQVYALRRARDQLEKEHNQLVTVSKLANEKVARLETANGEGANKVRRRLDAITQRWENLVTRVEEHSKMLVQAGRADRAAVYGGRERKRSGRMEESTHSTHSTHSSNGEAPDSETARLNAKIVDRFVTHVHEMERSLVPLHDWTTTFQVSKKPDQVRRMISVCQEKLLEIKDKEAGVARLQLELEHLHMAPGMSARDLKIANDAFQHFNKGWAKVVTKISEALNVLSGQADVGEEAEVAHGIEEWMESTQRVLNDLAKVPLEERLVRLEKLNAQLATQRENVGMIERDAPKRAIIGKGLDILGRKMEALLEPPPEVKILQEVEGEWSSVGDEKVLDEELKKSERLVEMARKGDMSPDIVERAETRRAEMEERKRVTHAAMAGLEAAEAKLAEIRKSIDEPCSSARDGLKLLSTQREELAKNENLKKEAERAADKMLAVDDGVPLEVVERTKARVKALQDDWKALTQRIDDDVSCASKEVKKAAQKAIGERQRTVDELEREVAKSEKATDAEEYSEYLDNLENLIDRVKSADPLTEIVQGMDESFVRESVARLTESEERATARAEERIAELAERAADAEKFERAAADISTWAGHVSDTLSKRRHADITALDVPVEYKNTASPTELVEQMSREFEAREAALKDMARFAESAPNERTQAQMEHAQKTMDEVKERLASFRHPAGFTTKVQKAWSRVAELENRLDEMVGIDYHGAEDALHDAKTMTAHLDELGEELASLDDGKENLLKEKLLSQGEADRIDHTLRMAKAKRKELVVRADNTVDRLDDCLILIGKMNEEGKKVDGVLDDVERRIQEFAKGDGDDGGAVSALLGEWNRNESGLKELESLERLVREKGAAGTEHLFLSRRTRADALKEVLNGWQRTLQAMEDDEESLLLQVEQLHDELSSKLDEAEGQEGKALSSTLSFLRGARDRLSARARRLCNLKPRMSVGDLVGDVNAKFSRLEAKLERGGEQPAPLIEEEEDEPTKEQIEEELASTSKIALGQRIGSLRERLHKARAHLDCERYPVESAAAWAARVDEVEKWMDAQRPAVEAAISEGRRLAESGSMELSTHSDIETLDQIVEDTQKLEDDVEAARDTLATLTDDEKHLKEDIAVLEGALRGLLKANLSDPEIARSIRNDLMEKESALADVSRRASELHAALPGRSSALRDTSLDGLNALLNELDGRLSGGKGDEDEEKHEERGVDVPLEVVHLAVAPESSAKEDGTEEEEEVKGEKKKEEEENLKKEEVARKKKEEEEEENKKKEKEVKRKKEDEEEEEKKMTEEEEKIKKEEEVVRRTEEEEEEKKRKEEEEKIKKKKEDEKRKEEEEEKKEEYDKVPDVPPHKNSITTTEPQKAGPSKEAEPKQEEPKALPKRPIFTQESGSRSPSLAMEVEDTGRTTEDELAVNATFPLFKKPEPPKDVEEPGRMGGISEMYETLDTIEDGIAFDEEFPLEKLDTAKERFDKMDADLTEAEACMVEHAMTMDMLESEQTAERIAQLRADIEHRRKRAEEHRPEWEAFQKALHEAIADVAALESQQQSSEGPQEETHSKAEVSVCEAVRTLAVMLPRMVESERKSKGLRKEVAAIEDRFRAVGYSLRETRAKKAAQEVDEAKVCKALEELSTWCTSAKADVEAPAPGALDDQAIAEALQKIAARIGQLPTKKAAFARLESERDRIVALERGDPATKHAIRRGVSETAKNISDLRLSLAERREALEAAGEEAVSFWTDVEEAAKLAAETKKAADGVVGATLYTPTPVSIDVIRQRAVECGERARALDERSATAIMEGGLSNEKLDEIEAVISALSAAQDAAARMPIPSSMVDSTASDEQEEGREEEQKIIKPEQSKREEEHDPVAEDEEEEEPSREATAEVLMATSQLTSTSGKITDSIPSIKERRMSAKEEASMQTLTLAAHWLTEATRDAAITVDVADSKAVKARASAVLTIMEQLREREKEVVRVGDLHPSEGVKKRATEILDDMEELLRRAERRRARLNDLAEEARTFEAERGAMEIWLTDGEAVIARPIQRADREELRGELERVESLISELDERREKMRELNRRADELMTANERDDLHALSHLVSRVNGHWSTFNDNIRIRRALLEASLRSRSDLHTALGEVEEWLDKTATRTEEVSAHSDDSHLLRDSGRRREAREKLEELQREVAAHVDVIGDVSEMSRKVMEALERGKEREGLNSRMVALHTSWDAVRARCKAIEERLEKAESEWEGLRRRLAELLAWTEGAERDLLARSVNMAGNLSTALAQVAANKNLARDIEERGPRVKTVIQEANAYLMQHDLRRKMATGGVLDGDEEEKDPITAEEQRCGLQLTADVDRLKEAWARLTKQSTEWAGVVTAGAARLQSLERALAECQLGLSALETELEQATPVENLRLEDLTKARKEADVVTSRVDELRGQMDEANAASAAVAAADAPLDAHPANQLEAVNKRYDALRSGARVRVAAIANALHHLGPSSEHFLSQSVHLPWQRAVSATNRLPYYIDHNTEKTQWDHPAWVELSRELATFNRVKFIAYRTAMKLRALQKRLCLDLIDLPALEKAFAKLELSNEESISLESMVASLVPLFETLHASAPHVIRSLSLAVDLVVNLMLNIYDPGRDGLLRTLSFKVALVVFCNAQLEDKYRYLFSLVQQNEHVDQKHMALLFYDLVHIPKLVGECAAFGGTNVEPSVRSLFETVRLAPSIALAHYLAWLKQEPQSIVWLPVMHRFALAEFAKHQAKCNVCKMFPIVGLRYRCLRCFNFDMCQNCFFSQRTSKNHKLKHPMQEYSNPTTSGEDVRDFGRIVKNKLTGVKRNLGYMPIELGEEGRPLAAPSAAATNPATEALHGRAAGAAARLAELSSSEAAAPQAPPPREAPTSPLQLINQVEMMQKDELDQLLQRLQLENMELKHELTRRKTLASQPNLDRDPSSTGGRDSAAAAYPRDGRSRTLPRLGTSSARQASVPTLHTAASTNDVEEEARALRLHQARLESRSRILSAQNQQLELQLSRVKKLIDQFKQKASASRTEGLDELGSRSVERDWGRDEVVPPPSSRQDPRGERMQSLLDTVDELGKAMESLVVSVVYNSDSE